MAQEPVCSRAIECLRAVADELARGATTAETAAGQVPRRKALIAPVDTQIWSLVDLTRAAPDRMDVIYRGGAALTGEVIVSWVGPQNRHPPLRMRIADAARLPNLDWRLTLEPLAIAQIVAERAAP
jgi:hypothetical protein